MRRVLVGMWIVVCIGGGKAMPAVAETSTPDSVKPLHALVSAYLATSDAAEAESLFAKILTHPDAALSTISQMLREDYPAIQAPVGFQPNRPVRVRNQTHGFGLYVPMSYTPEKAYPLVICLHGAGFTGDAYLERWQPRLGESYILACPTYGPGAWWTRFGEELVLATIRAVQMQYHIDPNRVYLTGMSNGGIGTWIIGMHHAMTFAGIAPMASGIDTVLYPFLENLRQTAVYIIHGSQDRVMPVWLSRELDKELTRLGIAHIYREHHRSHPLAGGHFFPREELPALVQWFAAHIRNPFPRRITLVRDASHLSRFGWVFIRATDPIAYFSENLFDSPDEYLKDRIYARLEALIEKPNHIVVQTRRVRRYTVFLNEELVDLSKPVRIVTNGQLSFEGVVKPNLSTLLREARRRHDPAMLFPVEVTVTVPKE
ncbi:MAG: hypothetical protein D6704_02365 [Nitrospirae bacterium]|nr:MAG: hypothetical protein D6704_02365 [Nitrospirota bacterium]